MTSLLGRVFGVVSSFSGRRKATESATEESASQKDDMTDGAKPTAKKLLFDGDDDDDDDTGADAGTSTGPDSSFKVDKEFARKYEHNKKREEKQKLEEKYGRAGEEEEDSSDDEDEDEEGYLLTDDLDARMTAALTAIKNKDPSIYDPATKFFDPAEIDNMDQSKDSETKQKPMFLRDYHRERYLAGDVGDEDDEDEAAPKTYQQEQDATKKELLDAMNAGDKEEEEEEDVDAFIKPKASKANKEAKAAAAAAATRPPKITEADVANADKNPELFLSNFLAARAWVPDDEDGPGWRAFESDDEDNGDADRAEVFETAYNMRFEDPSMSNEVLKSYSRSAVEAQTVRREAKTARQRQREQEKERLAAEKRERREERAQLRKLRVEEAQKKLAQIKKAAGIRGGKVLSEEAWTELLDGAWDTDKWEAKMQEQFGEGYYAEEDAGRESDEEAPAKKKKPKKPKWDDDIDIKDIIPEFDDAVPKISLDDNDEKEAEEVEKDEVEDEGEEDENENEADDNEQPAKRRKTGKDHKQERAEAKRQARHERARIEALVDRHMKLEAPTVLEKKTKDEGVGGFRYRETSPQSFGLTARDILLAPSDATLNEFAGLKKLATFRDAERKRKDRKTLGKKARLRQWRRETFGQEFEKTGPTYGFERVVGEASTASGHRKHKKDKAEDKTEGESTGKKRKRSGRKKDKKEAEAAEEA